MVTGWNNVQRLHAGVDTFRSKHCGVRFGKYARDSLAQYLPLSDPALSLVLTNQKGARGDISKVALPLSDEGIYFSSSKCDNLIHAFGPPLWRNYQNQKQSGSDFCILSIILETSNA